ncbi:MAG: hypothetical protein WCU88_00160 [Elusimicrobiota bacterium]|jgi:hypothetical protein
MKLTNRNNKKVAADFASSITSAFSNAKQAIEKTTTTTKKTPVKTTVKTSVDVQYPQEGEKVYKGHYAIRVDGTDVHNVLVSINNGDWQHCREACGHYWYDWYPAENGNFRIVAKATAQNGQETKSAIRNCKVL